MFKKLIFFLLLGILPSVLHSQDKEGVFVALKTSLGDIRILLYDSTPLHQQNFIILAREGYYDGQIFHRVIKNFMIQAGDPNSIGAAKGESLGSGDPGYTIPAEFRTDLYHKKGALAAARNSDAVNPKRESSGSQFYIIQGQLFSIEQLNAFVKMGRHAPFTQEEIETYTTIGGSPHLDGEYTVFGEVISGLDVVEKISLQPTDAYDRPLEDISFQVKILK